MFANAETKTADIAHPPSIAALALGIPNQNAPALPIPVRLGF